MSSFKEKHPMKLTQTAFGLLTLMRPANLVTAMGDTLAGLAIGGMISGAVAKDFHLLLQSDIAWLLLASVALYAGGVVLNDRADAGIDAIERPERPIPSGIVSKRMASWFVSILFGIALGASLLAGLPSFVVAVGTLVCILCYDLIAKNHSVWGPLTMGCCRSGNLLLGSSLYLTAFPSYWPFLLVPLLYIASITWISRFEVHGNGNQTGPLAIGAVVLIMAGLLIYGLQHLSSTWGIIVLLSLLLLFAGATLPSFLRVLSSGKPGTVQFAVKRGVLSLTILNSAIAASVGAVSMALIILSLLPLSIWVARMFRVT
ncbi:MAG: UbiA-like protein EboC [Balneolaceae bacterium]